MVLFTNCYLRPVKKPNRLICFYPLFFKSKPAARQNAQSCARFVKYRRKTIDKSGAKV